MFLNLKRYFVKQSTILIFSRMRNFLPSENLKNSRRREICWLQMRQPVVKRTLPKALKNRLPLLRWAKKRDTIETEKYSKENALDLKGSATRRAEFVCFVLFFSVTALKKRVPHAVNRSSFSFPFWGQIVAPFVVHQHFSDNWHLWHLQSTLWTLQTAWN